MPIVVDSTRRSPTPSRAKGRYDRDPTWKTGSSVLRQLAALTKDTTTNIECDTEVTTGLNPDIAARPGEREPADDLGFDRPVYAPETATAEPPRREAATRVERFDDDEEVEVIIAAPIPLPPAQALAGPAPERPEPLRPHDERALAAPAARSRAASPAAGTLPLHAVAAREEVEARTVRVAPRHLRATPRPQGPRVVRSTPAPRQPAPTGPDQLRPDDEHALAAPAARSRAASLPAGPPLPDPLYRAFGPSGAVPAESANDHDPDAEAWKPIISTNGRQDPTPSLSELRLRLEDPPGPPALCVVPPRPTKTPSAPRTVEAAGVLVAAPEAPPRGDWRHVITGPVPQPAWAPPPVTGPVPQPAWAPPPVTGPMPRPRPGTGPLSAIHELAGEERAPSDTLSIGPPQSTSFIVRYPWLLLVIAVAISAVMIALALVKRSRLEAGPQVLQTTITRPTASATPLIDPPDAGTTAALASSTAVGAIPTHAAPDARALPEPELPAAPSEPSAAHSEESLLRRARSLLDRGEYDAAHALFASLVAGAQETLGGYARSGAALGDGRALARFEGMLSEHDDLRRALRVRLLMAQRRWRQADAAYRRLPRHLRQQLQVQLWAAEIRAHRHHLWTAHTMYRRLLAAPELGHPRMRLEALLGHSEVLLRLRRRGAALSSVRLAEKLAASLSTDEESAVAPALRARIDGLATRVAATIARARRRRR